MAKILILADLHGNWPALEAIIERERTWDEVLFLGDVATSGAFPNEVADWLRAQSGVFVRGNHDQDLIDDNYQEPTDDPDRLWHRWTYETLSAKNHAFLKSLEQTATVERQGRTLRLYHGHRLPIGGRLWPDGRAALFHQMAALHGEPLHLTAHNHVQFRRIVGGVTFINPASVGQPRCGQPLAQYATMEEGKIQIKAAEYDIERIATALDDLPLPRDFIAEWQMCFRTGLLPRRYGWQRYAQLRAKGFR